MVYSYAAVEMVVFHCEEHVANVFEWEKETIIKDVDNVIYVNEKTGTEWKDEGSEVQKLKAEIEKAGNEAHKAQHRLSYMREWIMLYETAFLDIDSAKDSKHMRSDVDMIIARTKREVALSRARMLATEDK